jgi:hypothetical protein
MLSGLLDALSVVDANEEMGVPAKGAQPFDASTGFPFSRLG